ncbi:MAG: hypothetical protein AAF658_15575 [Myxococcota bacterium]
MNMRPQRPKVFMSTYGCQMNVLDSELVQGQLEALGYGFTQDVAEAGVVLINTCSVRELSEQKVWSQLGRLGVMKRKDNQELVVGVLGCMAERIKDKLFDPKHAVDLVAGPDAYRDLPRLLAVTSASDQQAINVVLSAEETYADILPSRLNEDSISGFV